MKIRIIEVKTGIDAAAEIREGALKELPSMHDNWRFNFDKQIKKLPNSTAYVLVTEEEPGVVQGCMIFQMVNKIIPNMAFIEIAPHNHKDVRKYDNVAGCLIAFAFQQSLKFGKGDYKGLLFLDVMEEHQEDQQKLIAVYTGKYNAQIVTTETLLISDEGGRELIERYLERK